MNDRLGPYAIQEMLGRGAMGAVYKARDERNGRVVALKVMRRADVVLQERFRREATAAAAVRHPGITAVLDAGVEAGVPFIAFELVTGGTLRARIKREGRFPLEDAVRIAREVADALAAIHAAGLVHRDVKPDNVLFDTDGRAKLSDFGLVRFAQGQAPGGAQLTATGEVVGTFLYLSPEQANGRHVDARSDLYSLGVVLFQLLTGETPFKGDGMALLMAHMSEAPPPPRSIAPDVPLALEKLVLALLAKSPDERPQSAGVVIEALDAIVAPAKPAAAKSSPKLAAIAIALLALVAIVIAAAIVVVASKEKPPVVVASPTPVPLPSSSSPPPTPPRPSPRSPSPAPSVSKRPEPSEDAKRQALEHTQRANELLRQANNWKPENAEWRDGRQAAIAALTEALALTPDDVGIIVLRGAIHEDLDEYEAAFADMKRALALDPDNTLALYYEGMSEVEQLDRQANVSRPPDLDKRLKHAEDVLTSVIPKLTGGRLAQAYVWRGRIHELRNEQREAGQDFDRAKAVPGLSPSERAAVDKVIKHGLDIDDH